ncbi:MAG: hypothetical protein JSV51_03810 [Candidatus Bathyarchaeota archaeon]|nr:MAG: hypothetical protein JSV51_03810 [Candidatus Bathyarchaeota archaeon]
MRLLRCLYLFGKYNLEELLRQAPMFPAYFGPRFECSARSKGPLRLKDGEVHREFHCLSASHVECIFWRIKEAGLNWESIHEELQSDEFEDQDRLATIASFEGKTIDEFLGYLVKEKQAENRCPSCGSTDKREFCSMCATEGCQRCMHVTHFMIYDHHGSTPCGFTCSRNCYRDWRSGKPTLIERRIRECFNDISVEALHQSISQS